MATVDDLARAVARDLSPEFEKRLREALAKEDREWLVDELVRVTLARHGFEDLDREAAATATRRAERLARVTAMGVNESVVQRFVADNDGRDRDTLFAAGYLRDDVPEKGTSLLREGHRKPKGEALLNEAKDMFFALLFGDASTGTHLDRVQQELLTLTVPRSKAGALDFMRASTEMAVEGTWQDPDRVSNDEHAENVVIEVQYGETVDELVGRGITTALSLINNLEINEQVLYARMINVEESTLIP